MALQDFIKKLDEREDSDVVYSKTPEPVTKIIPPSNKPTKVEMKDTTKVLPPRTEPITIKFTNFKLTKPINNIKNINIRKENKLEEPKAVEPKAAEVKKQTTEEDVVEKLFRESGTDLNRKQMWIDNYNAALKSKKTDLTTNMVRKGKFMIYTGNGKNELILLPENYIVGNKSSGNILNDKWV